MKKYKYSYIDSGIMIHDETVNELIVPIVSWLPVEKDLREFYIDMLRYLNSAIEENNKTKKPEQVAFEMNTQIAYKRDIQMDGVFEKYENRRSFVEKIYCPNKYSPIIQNVSLKLLIQMKILILYSIKIKIQYLTTM